MSSALTITEAPATSALSRIRMSSQEMTARRNAIFDVMKNAMIKGLDYGNIPGVDKPTLFKPGSEKLLSMFMLSAHPVVDDLSDEDTIRYRVTVIIKNISTGQTVGEGIGEASSNEDKYKWRAMVCQEEWDETPADRRRIKFKKGKQHGTHYKVSQVRAEKDDIANTILKMAKKRGQIDAVLTVTAASDVFSQDEDALETLGVEAIGAEGEEFITKEESTAWTDSVKAADIPTASARKFLREGLNLESSLQMKKHQLVKAQEWVKEQVDAKTKREEKKAEPAEKKDAASAQAQTQAQPAAQAQAAAPAQTAAPGPTPAEKASGVPNLFVWESIAEAFNILNTPEPERTKLTTDYAKNPEELKKILDAKVDEANK